MTVLNESRHTGEFMVSEANGHRSREQVTLAAGQSLDVGAVLGRITATGLYTEYAPAAADGSETAAAILYAAVDASAADSPAVIIARDAEVNAGELVWPEDATAQQITDGRASLADAGIRCR